MRIWYSRQADTQAHLFETQAERVSIGGHADNDIVLRSPYVAEHVAIIVRSGNNWELASLGQSDVSVAGHVLHPGERVLIASKQPIEIFPYTLNLEVTTYDVVTDEALREQLDADASQFILEVHRELLKRMDCSLPMEARGNDEAYLRSFEQDLEEIARLQGVFQPERGALLAHFAANTARGEMIAVVVQTAGQTPEAWGLSGRWLRLYTEVPEMEGQLQSTIALLSNELGLANVDDISRKMEMIEEGFWLAWSKAAAALFPETVRYLGLRYLKKQIKDIVFGYGPLEELLRMPNITEIMVVDREKIYIEKSGVVEKSGRRFVSDSVTESIIERIVSRVGRRIDRSQPLVDARLRDGSRVNAVIPPLAINGPCITIRKFPHRRLQVDDLIAMNSLTPTVAEFLKAAVAARCNILVSGGTGSGKTTLLNCLSNFIPDKERIVTIEDTAELQLQKEHVVRMETKAANVEGAGEYTIRDLVRNALRMRPDRIIVGECRGGEALDMLQAMNTGHEGSMTTVHANTADDVVLRLEVLVQMAADLPIHSIHRQIASAIHLIVQLARFRDGSRRVSQVSEVVGYSPREGVIRMKDLFRVEGIEGDSPLAPTGSLPTFLPRLIDKKLIDLNAFYL